MANGSHPPITPSGPGAISRARAAPMRIGALGLRATRGGWLAGESRWQFQNWKTAHAPQPVALPVVRPAIISVILLFILPRHWLLRTNRRAGLGLFVRPLSY